MYERAWGQVEKGELKISIQVHCGPIKPYPPRVVGSKGYFFPLQGVCDFSRCLSSARLDRISLCEVDFPGWGLAAERVAFSLFTFFEISFSCPDCASLLVLQWDVEFNEQKKNYRCDLKAECSKCLK